jgi:hypothetical protein
MEKPQETDSDLNNIPQLVDCLSSIFVVKSILNKGGNMREFVLVPMMLVLLGCGEQGQAGVADSDLKNSCICFCTGDDGNNYYQGVCRAGCGDRDFVNNLRHQVRLLKLVVVKVADGTLLGVSFLPIV